MSQYLVLIKDLVLGTQIRAVCEQKQKIYKSARSNEAFNDSLQGLKPECAVIDLNISSADPFLAIKQAQKSKSIKRIMCFYSHVNQDLADRAAALGISEIYRRSKFFNNLEGLLN